MIITLPSRRWKSRGEMPAIPRTSTEYVLSWQRQPDQPPPRRPSVHSRSTPSRAVSEKSRAKTPSGAIAMASAMMRSEIA